MDVENLAAEAKFVLEGKSRSYVKAAYDFAPVIVELAREHRDDLVKMTDVELVRELREKPSKAVFREVQKRFSEYKLGTYGPSRRRRSA